MSQRPLSIFMASQRSWAGIKLEWEYKLELVQTNRYYFTYSLIGQKNEFEFMTEIGLTISELLCDYYCLLKPLVSLPGMLLVVLFELEKISNCR
jgi:hypothetical protein